MCSVGFPGVLRRTKERIKVSLSRSRERSEEGRTDLSNQRKREQLPIGDFVELLRVGLGDSRLVDDVRDDAFEDRTKFGGRVSGARRRIVAKKKKEEEDVF